MIIASFCPAVARPSLAPNGGDEDGIAPTSPVLATRAIVDTGATTICISARVAAQLKIEPIGKVPVQGVARVSYHNSYLFMAAFICTAPICRTAAAAETRRLESAHVLRRSSRL